MAYLLDTNVFLTAKNSYYGLDFAPGFWDWIDQAYRGGRVYSIDRVRDELMDGADELSAWAKAKGLDFFLPPDEKVLPSLALVATWSQGAGYDPAAVNTFLAKADYYLVAHAHAHSFEIVTHETPATSSRRIKIPNACVPHGVKTVNTFTMLRLENARLVLPS